MLEAMGLLERAIAMDPRLWPGTVLGGCLPLAVRYRRMGRGAGGRPRDKAIDLARRALEATRSDDPGVLANAAFILANFGEEIGAMIGLVDRALSLNPSFARGWNISALLRLYAGELDLAIEHAGTALRLSPRERVGTPLVVMGLAYFFKRQFDEAASKLQTAVQENPGSPATYRILAACYAHMGLTGPARETLDRLRAITPAKSCRPCCHGAPGAPGTPALRPAAGDARGGMSRTRRPASIALGVAAQARVGHRAAVSGNQSPST